MGTETTPRRHGENAGIRVRFWSQLVLGAIFAALFVVTLAEPMWIETVFGGEPDAGNGSAEWLIVAVLGAAAALMLGLAGREHVRSATSRRQEMSSQR
jgi:uncharacterized RDD family membrane protein YckC